MDEDGEDPMFTTATWCYFNMGMSSVATMFALYFSTNLFCFAHLIELVFCGNTSPFFTYGYIFFKIIMLGSDFMATLHQKHHGKITTDDILFIISRENVDGEIFTTVAWCYFKMGMSSVAAMFGLSFFY